MGRALGHVSTVLRGECAGNGVFLPGGKAHNPYGFGVKVGITSTIKGNLILGARSFPHNPDDAHTLNEQLEQAQILSDSTIRNIYVDLGFRGEIADNSTVSIKHRGKSKRPTD